MLANIEFPEEVPSVLAHGGEGVGLYRTEFLYLNREELPSEEEHFRAYSSILERMQRRPVTIRTLDLGGDKLPIGHRSHEPNPALGLRAIRFTLRHPQLFRTQVRALLRASVHGKLQIMLPMVAAVGELRDAKGADRADPPGAAARREAGGGEDPGRDHDRDARGCARGAIGSPASATSSPSARTI